MCCAGTSGCGYRIIHAICLFSHNARVHVCYSLMAGVKMCLWCWWGWKFAGGLTELLMVPLGVKICSTVCLYLAHWSGSLTECLCVLDWMGKVPECAGICMSAQSCKLCVYLLFVWEKGLTGVCVSAVRAVFFFFSPKETVKSRPDAGFHSNLHVSVNLCNQLVLDHNFSWSSGVWLLASFGYIHTSVIIPPSFSFILGWCPGDYSNPNSPCSTFS